MFGEVFCSNLSALRRLNTGASHITLRGLGIHHSRGNGLVAANVDGVRVENCEISGHGYVNRHSFLVVEKLFRFKEL